MALDGIQRARDHVERRCRTRHHDDFSALRGNLDPLAIGLTITGVRLLTWPCAAAEAASPQSKRP